MEKFLHRVAYCIYSALCIAGLLWQVSLLSQSYFKYDVSNDVKLHYARKSADEALNVCFFYHEIFLYEKYGNETGNHIDVDISDVSNAFVFSLDLIENLTIDEMLKYTPSVNETIQECSIRMVKNDGMVSYQNGAECNQQISVSKYVSNYLVCYRFLFPDISNSMDTILISSDVYEAFVIQSITFNETSFGDVNFFLNMINSRKNLPLREYTKSIISFRGYRPDTNIHGSNMFGVRYYQSITKNLAPPYTTMCRNYSYIDCLTECIQNDTLDKFDRYSPASFHDHGEYRLITSKYLDEDRSRIPKYLKTVRSCEHRCPWNQCEGIIAITSTDEQMAWESFRLFVSLQNAASIEVNNVPKMYFIDYMTFVSSCFGTWLGISFLGLNPFKFSSKSLRPRTVSPAHDQRVLPAQDIQKLVSMSNSHRHLIRLLFQTVKNQQEQIKELDQEVAKGHKRC